MTKKDKTTVGRAENVILLDFGNKEITAKVDTGADRNSIWASNIKETEAGLSFTLFGKDSDHYTGEEIVVPKKDYKLIKIYNSFGHSEWRYMIKIRIKLQGRIINSNFTLADRQTKVYPALIGWKLLKGKFIVDVSKGDPLIDREDEQKQKLEEDIRLREASVN